MAQFTYSPSTTVRVLFVSMIVGWLAFMGTLFAGPFGLWGLVVPLGFVAVAVVGQALAGRPWRMIVNADMANVFLTLGVIGLAASVYFLLISPSDRPVMEPAPLVVLGLTMALSIALGVAARREISKR